MQIGFWGAGLMGSGLAKNLLRHDYHVLVYSRDLERAKEIASCGANGRATSNLLDLASSQVLLTCVARPTYLCQGLLGATGLYAKLAPKTLHIECSTIDPKTATQLATTLKAQGSDYLQATLGKTPAMAEKAEEPIFVGGDADVQKRAWELLTIIGKPENVGTIEASCGIKLLSNLIGMTNIAVLAEGMRIGRAMGIDSNQLLKILSDTGARSYQMDLRGPMMAESSYSDAKFRLTLALKDLILGTDMAHLLEVATPLMDTARMQFQRAETQGLGDKDCAAVAEIGFSANRKG